MPSVVASKVEASNERVCCNSSLSNRFLFDRNSFFARGGAKKTTIESIPIIQTEYWRTKDNCELFAKICHIDQRTLVVINTLTVNSESGSRFQNRNDISYR